MKQEWYCENCNKSGSVLMRKHTQVFEAIGKVNRDHERTSPDCKDASKIRVRAPICTQREWDKVRRLKENRLREAAADKALKAIGNWVDAGGGKAIIAGGPGIMDAAGQFNFYVCIKVTGRRPERLGLKQLL